MCASDSGMSDPSRMVVGVAGPVSFYNVGSDHFATDHFLEQFLPVRHYNKDNIENILDDMEHGVEELSGPKSCLNVTCNPEPFCASWCPESAVRGAAWPLGSGGVANSKTVSLTVENCDARLLPCVLGVPESTPFFPEGHRTNVKTH